MLFLVEYDEAQFTRSLDSFNTQPAVYIVEFDASLTGAGVLIYQRVDAVEVCVAVGVRLHFTAALLSTAFLESSMVSAARAACRLTVKKL